MSGLVFRTACTTVYLGNKKYSSLGLPLEKKHASKNVVYILSPSISKKISNTAVKNSSAYKCHRSKEKNISWGWRSGSVLKSTYCSCRKHGFSAQHPHSFSQPQALINPVPSNQIPSCDFCWYCTHMVLIYTTRHTHTHKIV